MNELALFAGAGGGILGGKLLGFRCVCAVERDAYCAQILAQRQNDRILEPFPIWSDVRSFDGKPWRGLIDVVSAGFPCQDISISGKGRGLAGERSGLWFEAKRIIDEVQPKYVFVENSPMLNRRGLARILADLAGLGFDAAGGVVGACDAGLDHDRKRQWVLAYANGERLEVRHDFRNFIETHGDAEQRSCFAGVRDETRRRQRETIARIPRSADGVAHRVERIRAIGNGQVPAVGRIAWNLLREQI